MLPKKLTHHTSPRNIEPVIAQGFAPFVRLGFGLSLTKNARH
jgi:hypothetical protein